MDVLSSLVPVPEVGGHSAQLQEAVPGQRSVCIGTIDVGTELATGELPVPAQLEVPRQIERELAVLDAVAFLAHAHQRREEVRVVGRKLIHRPLGVGICGAGSREGCEVVLVLVREHLALAGVGRPFCGVGADRLEQSVTTHAGTCGDERDQALVHEAVERLDDVAGSQRIDGADGLCSVNREAVDERRSSSEQHSFGVFQQVVGPLDRRLQA